MSTEQNIPHDTFLPAAIRLLYSLYQNYKGGVVMRFNHFFATVMLAVVSYPQVVEARGADPGVLPIQSHAFGKSYGEWGQEFSNWLIQFSVEDFPLFQGSGEQDCSIGQNGKVWFLHGVLDGAVERSCTIPQGKGIFISVNSVTSFVPAFGNSEEEVRADAKRDLDGTSTTIGVATLEVYIDGVPVSDPFSYRADSPEGGFVLVIEEGTILNQLGFDAGEYEPAIVDGYWVLLRPLSVGDHTIRWLSSGQFQDGTFYNYDATWHLTVGK